MPEKTNTFFIIDNFNTIPIEILSYCKDFIVYDASTDIDISLKLEEKNIPFIKIPRTGHNITTYFRFFIDYYNCLPEFMCLTKGHMIGRHCSKSFFDRVYNNKFFTFIYEDKDVKLCTGYSALAMENIYLEKNDSWYVLSESHPHRYFDSFNRLLKFIYKDPVIPEYCFFAPGACYIVSKEHVLKQSREFYINLNKIMGYELNPNFPSEAHQIERMLPIIFMGNYKVNEWMNDTKLFDERLEIEREITLKNDIIRKSKNRTLKNRVKYMIDKCFD